MTQAEFFMAEGMHDIRISGHACFGEPDIVCSAASMLACTLIEALKDQEGFRFRMSSGEVNICAGCGEKTDIIVDTVKKGYAMLAKKYPGNVRMLTAGRKKADERMEKQI